MQGTRAAIYARYSGDRQRETSIDDQVRNCVRHAERDGLTVRTIYQDKAISGSVAARSDYQRMIAAADAGEFDVLLLDDLSRLSRDDYETKGLLRRFGWLGLRVVAVTDGYDNQRKGHKIHAGFKSLVNEIFLDDLRERTHRGMTGQALKGYNCGGRTYGYRNVAIEDAERKDHYGRPVVVAVKFEIDAVQAEIVRQVYGWYATGHSYKWIAAALNRTGIRASRGGTWAISAVKVILENEMYEGRVCWNRRAWMKNPDTGRRTYKLRPSDEWIVTENPSLRIVDAEVIQTVRARQAQKRRSTSATAHSARRFLFSGLLACAECGSNFVIVSGGRYGCAAHKARGRSVCGNGITVSRHIVEHQLLAGIKNQLRAPNNFERFERAATTVIERLSSNEVLKELEGRLKAAERTKQNILTAIKQGVITSGTKEELEVAESDVVQLRREIEQASGQRLSGSLPRALDRYREAVTKLEDRLAGHVEPARELLKSLLGDRIRMHRRGEHLEAELPDHVPAALASALNVRNDLGGCGGRICTESSFVSLAASSQDSTPLKYRRDSAVPTDFIV